MQNMLQNTGFKQKVMASKLFIDKKQLANNNVHKGKMGQKTGKILFIQVPDFYNSISKSTKV